MGSVLPLTVHVHCTLYNHAWGSLFKNRLGHVLLLNPGCKHTGCWNFGNLSKPTSKVDIHQPTHPLLGQRMVYFFVKFIHSSAGFFINPSIRKQSSFYLVTFILLYALIRPSTRIHLPIDILQFIHPSTGIRSSFNRNFFILLPEFIHPSAGIFIHPSIGMQSSFYRISLILIHPLIRPSTRIHLPIYWIVFILT